MADSKAIAARVHPDVHEWISNEAEKQGTTIGSFVEEMLRSAYVSEMEAQSRPDYPESQEVAKVEEVEIESAEEKDGELVVEAGSKETADEVREVLSEYILPADDKRFTQVHLSPDAKGEIAGL
mgnify:CR=1 FL=1